MNTQYFAAYDNFAGSSKWWVTPAEKFEERTNASICCVVLEADLRLQRENWLWKTLSYLLWITSCYQTCCIERSGPAT